MSDVRLQYLQSSPLALRADGAVGIHQKTLSGLHAFRERWDGPVAVSCLENASPVADDSGIVWEDDPAFEGVEAQGVASVDEIVARERVLVHAPVNAPGIQALLGRVPLVLGDDNAPQVRTEITLVNARSEIDALRIKLGAIRRTRRFDGLAARVPGFHANGYAASAHYARFNSATLRYFDHRIRASDLPSTPRRSEDRSGASLHIAYSGRFLDIKGVGFIPAFAKELRRRGLNVRISVIGSGPLEQSIRREGEGLLDFPGYMDFESEWKKLFRDHVDVAFLPHIQGDSSSTYFEAMGMGVPVLGFANATLSPLLADGGGGWAVAKSDLQASVQIVEQLISRPALLQAQRERALHFMRDKSMEDIFDRRVEDFERVAGSLLKSR